MILMMNNACLMLMMVMLRTTYLKVEEEVTRTLDWTLPPEHRRKVKSDS